jgi:hypothetical protein
VAINLFFPKRFPRLRRFPRFRRPKPGECYCGQRGDPNLNFTDQQNQWRSFCSEECADVYLADTGMGSYFWQKRKFDQIKKGRVDPGFYEIRRFPRRK